jgi:hypothetical protein
MVPDLGKQMFLVADGARVTPLATRVRGRPGTLRTSSFTVGAQPVSGALVFDLPAGDVGDLLLVVIDENNGVIRIPLKGNDISIGEGKSTQTNELMDVVLMGSRDIPKDQWPKDMAEGTKLVAVDVRWASRVKAPKAKTGRIVNIPDWKQTFQLIVDDEFAARLHDAPMDQAASVLPEVFTGGELVYIVPADLKTSRLDLHFSMAPRPGLPKPIRPKTISFDLAAGPAVAPPEAKQTWSDAYFRSELIDVRPAKISGFDSTVVRYRVTNKAKSWEILQPFAQYKARTADRPLNSADVGLVRDVPRGGLETLLIPPGATRQFDLVYSGGEALQILYASAEPDGGSTIDLKPGAAAAVAAAPQKTSIHRTRQPEDDAPAPAPPAEKVLKPADYPPLPDPKSLQAKGIAGVGLKPEHVNTAIDRGADALWLIVKDNYVDPRNLRNTDILAALAMTYSGLHKRNPEYNEAVRRAIDHYRPHHTAMYEAGLMLMLIEIYGSPSHLPIARQIAQGIVDSQCLDGSFSYTYKGVHKEPEKPKPVTNGPIEVTGGEEIKDAVPDGIIKRVAPVSTEKGGDNSTTQYAILGLASAERMGIQIDKAVWKAAFAVTAKRQDAEDGGWAYHDPSSSYGAMTAAGLTSYAIAQHYGDEPSQEKAVQKALLWLNAHFSVSRHPRSGDQWHYYYLYGVERLGRVMDTEFLGSHEWYPMGAKFLVDMQGRDGAWRGKAGTEVSPEYATSFALLFLTKATPTLNEKIEKQIEGSLTITAKTPAPRPAPPPPAAPKPEKPRIYFILDCSGSMLAEIDGKAKFDIARDAVKAMIEKLPDGVQVGLRVYGHRKRAIEKDADKDVEEIVPMSDLDKPAILARLDALRSRGKTPLAESLRQTAQSVRGATEKNPITVILLTDGGEDTRPRGDPVAAAGELAAIPGVRLTVVGFDINQDDWTKQLTDIAAAGKGRFVSAADATKLTENVVAAADAVINPQPVEIPPPPPEPKLEAFKVTDADGKVVASGEFGQTLKLKPGKYRFETTFDGKPYAQDLFIAAGRSTSIVFAP